MGFTFAPVGWSLCNGQLMAIADNPALFQLLGTTYGGDGQSTFAVPDLQGRTPLHQGNGFTIGERAGQETVTLIIQQMPQHSHPLIATGNTGTSNNPQGNLLAKAPVNIYRATNPTPKAAMNGAAISSDGGSQPHENRQPFLTLNWIIALFGIFPAQ